MRCRKCGKEFDAPIDYRQGKHAEYECPCGQLLQWDYQFIEPTGRGGLVPGPPQSCEHPDRQKPGALVPLPR